MRIQIAAVSIVLGLCTAGRTAGAAGEIAPPAEHIAAARAAHARALAKPDQPTARETYTKQQLHGVQLALMRWSVDSARSFQLEAGPDKPFNGYFPQSLNALFLEGYLYSGFYFNAYAEPSGPAYNALNVPFGWTELAPGNFTYLKHYNAAGHVDDHILVAYGADPDGGFDVDGDGKVDGAIITLTTANWAKQADAPDTVQRDYWSDHGQRVSITEHKPEYLRTQP